MPQILSICNLITTRMNNQGYFQLYMELISDAMKTIRKISFKKMGSIGELLSKFENFLSKEVYGRIKPANYLMLFLLALGGRNPKLYQPLITTIQKLFANNFINADEELSGTMQFLKEEHTELLLLPVAEYSRKSFQELYIETLVALPDRNEPVNLLIAKNMSLIFRLSQNNLPASLITNICDFLLETILQNRDPNYDKILKSTFLEIVRHAIESLKEASDRKLLEDDEHISIKQVCERYGTVLADRVAIQLSIEKEHQVPDYQVIPTRQQDQTLNEFKLLEFQELNERNEKNGKFGWCAVCRKAANFYCRSERLPVCSYACKQLNLYQTQQLEKFYQEETKSVAVFTSHVEALGKIFATYLSHPDIAKRSGFAEVFFHLSSELRKISVKACSPQVQNCLQDIFRQCVNNVVMENEAFQSCLPAIRKMIPLQIFTHQMEILLHQLAQKLTYFLTPAANKQQILNFIGELIKSEVLFDLFMNIDCKKGRKDVVQEIINAVSKVYIGVPVPEGITVPIPPEDPLVRNKCFQILILLEKGILNIKQSMDPQESKQIEELKKHKNIFKNAVNRFNNTEKPTKVIKKLISEKYLPDDPSQIARWIHKNIKKLSFINIGQLIGDHDPLGMKIRDEYIRQMNFKGHLIDEGMRILLAHFTIPGESQIVNRIIESFSKEYFEQNEGQKVFLNADAVFSFSYLLMMLQTNLHNPQVQASEKMTLAQYSNLSKNMNGPGSEFPADFLEEVYQSIEKKQLGFHSKLKEIEVINAFNKNELKRAQQIHFKHLYKHLNKEYDQVRLYQPDLSQHQKYSTRVLVGELFGDIIQAVSTRIRETEDREELFKNVELMEEMIKFSTSIGVEEFVAQAIKSIWEQLSRATFVKKYMLIERTFVWVRDYTAFLYDQWSTIIVSFSMFYRTKAIRKDNTSKNKILEVFQDKCYLYESYIEGILAKSNKFNYTNLVCLVEALVECSKQEVAEGQMTFCLEKIGDVFEHNNSRLTDVVPLTWPKLREYYVELCKSKIENVAIFGIDFLKQLITKFIKKKDLQFYQKQYIKAYQQIFSANVYLAVKEYVVGGLSYFVNNYAPNLKEGWKTVLLILCDSFEQEEDQIVKEKSHLVVKKIYETKFTLIDLDENYNDFVEILGRMAREKDEVYINSCLEAIKAIITFYEAKLEMNLEQIDSEQNGKFDLIFWQTMWLPLLSAVYGVCGDFRPDVQNEAIQLLFYILMRYGKLFKYEFWKMILQGILRPTFEEITYTSQSKPLRKKQLEEWLRNSFSQLFTAINKLIQEYFEDFKLFLPDILKIYQSCILSNSNKILTQLSTEALTQLLSNVAIGFEPMNWNEYIEFVAAVLRKSSPSEISSVEAWNKSKEAPEQLAYQGKILTLHLILVNCQSVVDSFSINLQQNNLLELRQIIQQTLQFAKKFNKNVELRDALWKNGFFEDMKSLPGLVKQQHEALKCLDLIYFKLIDKSEVYADQYAQHSLQILSQYQKSLIVTPPTPGSLHLEQKQREGTMLQVIILENIMPNLQKIGLSKLIELGYKGILFSSIVSLCSQKTFCSQCKCCELCEKSAEREAKFTTVMRRWLLLLFEFESQK